MRWKRLFYYLIINILVSACTVLAVLYAWERYRPQVVQQPEPVVFLPTATSQAVGAVETDAAVNGSAPDPTTVSEYVTYEVQQGDSLFAIAAEFDVTVEAILAANQLENPDALNVGDVLLIPLVPDFTPPPEATAAAAPTSTLPPPPTLDPAAATPADFGVPELQILTVIGAGDLSEERVIIRQNGEAQVSLQGWQLLAPDGQVYVFPQLVLFKDGAVTVYSRAGANNVAELHWGLDVPVWASGAVVTLMDPDGSIVAAYQIP